MEVEYDELGFPLWEDDNLEEEEKEAIRTRYAVFKEAEQAIDRRQEIAAQTGGAAAWGYLLRGGAPRGRRRDMWNQFAKVGERKERHGADYYASLVEQADSVPDPTSNQIDLDLHRTFPGHKVVDTNEGRAILREVLHAYALHNREIGYVQSMNYVCGMVMIVTECAKEETFWLFTAIMDIFPSFYRGALEGVQVAQKVFEKLMSEALPDVWGKLDGLGVELAVVTYGWFMTLFTGIMAPAMVLQVWDVILFEGVFCGVFSASLALFGLAKNRILACEHAADALQMRKFVSYGVQVDRFFGEFANIHDSISREHVAELWKAEEADQVEQRIKLRKQKEVRRCMMTTDFDSDQLGELYEQFMLMVDANPELHEEIAFELFHKVLVKVLPQVTGAGSEESRRLFEMFDKDHSGAISFKELMAGLSIFYGGNEEEKVMLLFNVYDQDNNGTLSFAELEVALHDAHVFIHGHPPKDRDRSRWNKAFRTLDKDHSGQLDRDEFLDVIRVFPDLLEYFKLSSQTTRVKSRTMANFINQVIPGKRRAKQQGKDKKLDIFVSAEQGTDPGQSLGTDPTHQELPRDTESGNIAPMDRSLDEKGGAPVAQEEKVRAAESVPMLRSDSPMDFQKLHFLADPRLSTTEATAAFESVGPKANSESSESYSPPPQPRSPSRTGSRRKKQGKGEATKTPPNPQTPPSAPSTTPTAPPSGGGMSEKTPLVAKSQEPASPKTDQKGCWALFCCCY